MNTAVPSNNVDLNSPRGVITGPDNVIGSGNAETIKMIEDLYEQGVNARKPFDTEWQTRMDFYLGKQWSQGRAGYKAKPVLNIIRSTIQGMIPILTDQRPGINVVPADPTDYDFARILSDQVESWWDRVSMDHVMIEVIMDMMIYDIGVLKVTWNPEAEEGAGDISISVVNPKDIYTPYGARDFGKDCPWVIHRITKTVGELRLQFPQLAQKITPDGQTSSQSDQDKSIRTDVVLVSPIDKKGNNTTVSTSMDQSDTRKTTTVWEIWMDDSSIEEINVEDDQGQQTTQLKKKWPRGRLITYLPNTKTILQDVDNPYMHAKKSFVRFVDSILPRVLWGQGEVGSLVDQQKIINRILANIMDHVNLMSNPIWICEQGSGVSPDAITNQVGCVLNPVAGKGSSVRRDFPPALQSGAIDLLQFMLRQSESISGSSDVSQGRQPVGVSAAAAIQSLQEAAQTRIRLKERNLSVSLSQLGYQVVQLMMQFYTEPRMARISGKTGYPRYVEFWVESTSPGKMRYNTRTYTMDTSTGSYTVSNNGQWTSGPETKGVMDIKILAGTSLPYARAQRANVAFRLFDSKAIDVEELLDTLEWPNKEKLMERLRAEGMIPAEGQAQAQPGQPPQAGVTNNAQTALP